MKLRVIIFTAIGMLLNNLSFAQQHAFMLELNCDFSVNHLQFIPSAPYVTPLRMSDGIFNIRRLMIEPGFGITKNFGQRVKADLYLNINSEKTIYRYNPFETQKGTYASSYEVSSTGFPCPTFMISYQLFKDNPHWFVSGGGALYFIPYDFYAQYITIGSMASINENDIEIESYQVKRFIALSPVIGLNYTRTTKKNRQWSYRFLFSPPFHLISKTKVIYNAMIGGVPEAGSTNINNFGEKFSFGIVHTFKHFYLTKSERNKDLNKS